jgi:hypothetical protein
MARPRSRVMSLIACFTMLAVGYSGFSFQIASTHATGEKIRFNSVTTERSTLEVRLTEREKTIGVIDKEASEHEDAARLAEERTVTLANELKATKAAEAARAEALFRATAGVDYSPRSVGRINGIH